MTRRGLRTAAAALALALATAPAASAITPPVLDGDAAPPSGSPAADMTQRTECVATELIAGTNVGSPQNQLMLDLAAAWRFSRGDGQTVAVIDTGVNAGPRLPNVTGAGDYVGDSDGLSDCDGHGTLVAGVIAGQPGNDGFSGVAPGAKLISIRQTSAHFDLKETGDEDRSLARAEVDIDGLARAVVRAADQGATVINISVTTCLPATDSIEQDALGAALRYAAEEKNAVIVAAAGNVQPLGTAAGPECAANPLNRPGTADPRNWAGVGTVSTPSWWQPYVLSVGSVGAAGQPSAFTMSGPWLGLAGPGENVLSLSNSEAGGLANGMPDGKGGLTPVMGTSFAAAYVSGTAALVRSRFPELTAAQVIERLTATASNGAQEPSNVVGAGTVDPLAALTWQVPDGAPVDIDPTVVAAPIEPDPVNHTARNIALAGTAGLAALVAVIAYVVNRRKEPS